jgi:hypothetical protein
VGDKEDVRLRMMPKIACGATQSINQLMEVRDAGTGSPHNGATNPH